MLLVDAVLRAASRPALAARFEARQLAISVSDLPGHSFN
jgi:hypothetical protein